MAGHIIAKASKRKLRKHVGWTKDRFHETLKQMALYTLQVDNSKQKNLLFCK